MFSSYSSVIPLRESLHQLVDSSLLMLVLRTVVVRTECMLAIQLLLELLTAPRIVRQINSATAISAIAAHAARLQ